MNDQQNLKPSSPTTPHSALKIVARESRLSLLQVKEAMSHVPDADYKLVTMPSYGDKHLHISLLDSEAPADFFTRELDEALINGEADLAIHSAKDLPYPLDERLEVVALLPPFDQTDSLVSREHLKLSELPAGSTVGTSSPMRRRELLALRPDLRVEGIRGSIEQRVEQVVNGRFDAAIVATCALKRLGMTSHISEVLPFETHPLQGYLAITAKKGRAHLKALFQTCDVLQRQGKVTLVGFGPGDPELLTVKAVKALQQADIILHDDLIDKEYIGTLSAEKVYVGKRNSHHHAEQAEINKMLLAAARQGRQVVRLKGGDPMLFSHAGEEIEYLQRNLISVSVVPGITAASALAAATKTPLTHRGLSSGVAFVNGHSKTLISPATETVVYYMGGTRLADISRSLLHDGWAPATPVTLVHDVSRPTQAVFRTTVAAMGQLHCPTPLTALVGSVAALPTTPSDSIKRTLYTGLVCPNPAYIHTPLIEIKPTNYEAPSADDFDFLLFTSRYAVKHWTRRNPLPRKATIVSIGQTTTRALHDNGAEQIEQACNDDSYGVIDYFRQSLAKGLAGRRRVLLPRSDKALDIIPQGLQALGYEVTTVTVYSNVYPSRGVRRVNLANIARVVFTSPSTIDNFIETYGEFPTHIEYVTRGAITAEHLKSRQKK